MKQTDNKIEQLQALVSQKEVALELKKDKLGKPITNMVLELDEKTYSLHTLNNLEKLLSLYAQLRSIEQAMLFLGCDTEMKFSNYTIYEWTLDIEYKIKQLEIKEESTKLNKLKKTLESKLSEDRKLELELKEIEESLK